MATPLRNRRLLLDEPRAVWRAVRDGSLTGMRKADLQQELGIKAKRLAYRLTELRQGGFLRKKIVDGRWVWVLGEYVLPGEVETLGADSLPVQPADVITPHTPEAAPLPSFASIWAYAAHMGGQACA